MSIRTAPGIKRKQRRPVRAEHPRRDTGTRRGWLLRAAIVLSISAVLFSAARLYTSGNFIIRSVEVRGVSALSVDQVLEAAALSGQEYFTADAAAAAARVRGLAWVKSARVVIHLPRSATITIVERTPAGVWQVGAVSYLIDAEGVVLDAAASVEQTAALPVVDASRLVDAIRVGDRVDPDPLNVAMQLAGSLPGTVGATVARLDYDHQNGVTAVTSKGTIVRLGDGQNLDFKLQVWQATVAKVPQADLHELDLRYGDRPYYR